jgi:hypothetical protein
MEQRNDRFRVEVSVGDVAVDVRVTGEIDIATVGAFRSALWAQPHRPLLRLDLSGVAVLSAAGVRRAGRRHLGIGPGAANWSWSTRIRWSAGCCVAPGCTGSSRWHRGR